MGRAKNLSLYTTNKRKAHQRALLDALENLIKEVLSDPRLTSAHASNTKANSLNQE